MALTYGGSGLPCTAKAIVPYQHLIRHAVMLPTNYGSLRSEVGLSYGVNFHQIDGWLYCVGLLAT